jgi:hypothetical protein
VKLARHLEFIYPVPMPLILLASPHFLTRSIARLVAIITHHYPKRTIGKNSPRPPVFFLPTCFWNGFFRAAAGASIWVVGGFRLSILQIYYTLLFQIPFGQRAKMSILFSSACWIEKSFLILSVRLI